MALLADKILNIYFAIRGYLYCCIIFFVAIIIIELIFPQTVLGQNWPSLYEPQDFFQTETKAGKEKTVNINKQNIEKISQEDIRKKLYNSFYFIHDFSTETRGERPRGWINPQKDPQKALELGYPQVIKRPNNVIHFPIYPLTKITYFKGDSVTNSAINVCQTFWAQSLYQEAYNCFASLQVNVERGIYSTTPLIKMQINILQGFFMLHLLLIDEKNVKNVSFGTIPPILVPFKPGEILTITAEIFNYIATGYKDDLYLPEKKSNNIMSTYAEFFHYPHYFINGNFTARKTYTVSLNEESIETLTWVRSVLPIVYINLIGLSNATGNQERAFNIIEKFENYLQWFDFPKQDAGSAIFISSLPNVKEDIFLKPLNNIDMLTISDLFKTLMFQKSMQPDTALTYISRGILRNGDPDLSSLLFKLSADAYYDLNILQLGRRVYSWSEMYSKNFVYKVPSILFFGAESAFWLGQYDVAKKGFQRFLLASGDIEYAPQARLRLALIEQLQGNDKGAKSIFEYIVRNLGKHQVTQDAAVNLFCMDVNHLNINVRKQKYKKIAEKINDGRADLQRQAKACLMHSDLLAATEDSATDNKKNVVEKAKIQKDIINKYNKEFPNNEFIVLFSDRIKQLELVEAAFLTSENKCKDLINFYEKNNKDLILLSKKNNKYVKGLKWAKEERRKLLRCSALLNDFELWKKARNFDIGKDGEPIQTKFYNLSIKPSSWYALNLYSELKKSAYKWDTKLNTVENSGSEITNLKDFWELLALRKFLNYEFSASEAAKNLLSNAIVKDLMKEPKMIFELPIFCTWLLREFDKLSSDDLDTVAQTQPSKEWLNLFFSPLSTNKCTVTLAQNLLSRSFKQPSDLRDRVILLPYLEKRGFADASEDWLSYVQRLEQDKGVNNPNVIDIYENLKKSSKDSLVKNSATLWLKKNFPEDADKLLW